MKKWIAILSLVIVILGISLLTHINKQKNSWVELINESISLYHQEKYAEAASKAQEATKITEKYFGSDHVNVANCLNTLAAGWHALVLMSM